MSTNRLILIVEDDPHDVFFLKRAFSKMQLDFNLHVVTDGEQALNYLNGHLQYSDRTSYPVPSLIFLDLKLPYFSGFEILEHIRSNSSLASIPVFVLTSSSEECDRQRASDLGARAYLVKPASPEVLTETLRANAIEISIKRTS